MHNHNYYEILRSEVGWFANGVGVCPRLRLRANIQ